MNKKQPKYTPRSLARSVARANMLSAGIERVNRRFYRWREWVFPALAKRRRTAAACKIHEVDKNGKWNELCDARIE